VLFLDVPGEFPFIWAGNILWAKDVCESIPPNGEDGDGNKVDPNAPWKEGVDDKLDENGDPMEFDWKGCWKGGLVDVLPMVPKALFVPIPKPDWPSAEGDIREPDIVIPPGPF